MKQVSNKGILKKWGNQVDYERSKEIKEFLTREELLPFDTAYMAEE